MTHYYTDKLSAERLRHCYEIAPPRVQQYLQAEIDHVLHRIHSDDMVLELGCGYGRVLMHLAEKAEWAYGIDNSLSSLLMAKRLIHRPNCSLTLMDAANLGFRDKSFDVVICIQNGISAFHVDHEKLFAESVRVARSGGTILFSSYSDNFWEDRLEWFELQAQEGLVGPINYDKTGGGNIVCTDGFTATTVRQEELLLLARKFNFQVKIEEVDRSSIFCEMRKN